MRHRRLTISRSGGISAAIATLAAEDARRERGGEGPRKTRRRVAREDRAWPGGGGPPARPEGPWMQVYVEQFGTSPLAAIQTGTLDAADQMGWSDKVGSLEPGQWADIIAVAGDPLKDITRLQHVAFVMKAGVIYKGGDTR